MKKNVLLWVGAPIVFSLLSLVEKRIGIGGFCTAFMYALLFCNAFPPMAILPYVVCSSLVFFSLNQLFISLISLLPSLVLLFFHFRFKKKYRIKIMVFCSFLARGGSLIFYHHTVEQILFQVGGMVVSGLFFFVFLVFLYPILVRGLRYKLSHSEKVSVGLFVALVGAGIYFIPLFNVGLLYFFVTAYIVLYSVEDRKSVLWVSVSAGLGASIMSFRYAPTFLCLALSCGFLVFSAIRRRVGILGGILCFLGGCYFLKTLNIATVLPAIVAGIGGVIPEKYLDRIFADKISYQGKFAMRTMMNRDRAEMERKLEGVADAFLRVKNLLCYEENSTICEDEIVATMCSFCQNCPKSVICKMGKNREKSIRNLVKASLERGRASLLDAGSELSEYCIKLPKLISETNDTVTYFRKRQEQNTTIDKGKQMIINHLDGTANLLKKMADSVGTSFGFDTRKEAKIQEELGYVDIVASDVAIYGEGKEGVTLVVRETDADKPQLKKVISAVAGTSMSEVDRRDELEGNVIVRYCKSPEFGVLYGESSLAKEGRCGDTNRAIRLGFSKIMFVLSDGMGTGKSASQTAESAVGLVESFYKAGFDHSSVFSCVAQLLSLRRKEDFSALDIVIADTQTGEIEFVKQGGRESYVLSENTLVCIEGGSLPVGIIEDNMPKVTARKMHANDMVVMLSDGVADRLEYADILDLIERSKTTNPQVISELIIKEASKRSGNEDDMTALVIRIVKNKL